MSLTNAPASLRNIACGYTISEYQRDCEQRVCVTSLRAWPPIIFASLLLKMVHQDFNADFSALIVSFVSQSLHSPSAIFSYFTAPPTSYGFSNKKRKTDNLHN